MLSERFYALIRREEGDFVEKAANFKTRLLQRYPHARSHVLFSLFSDAHIPLGNGPFDFPAPDSIEQFINREYTAAYPEYVLFSLLSDSEPPEGLSDFDMSDEVQQFMAERYEPTVGDVETHSWDKDGLNWLEKPLQLIKPTELPDSGKVTIPPEEHPFRVSVNEPPATPSAPPAKGLNRWLKRLRPGKNESCSRK